MGVIQGDTGVLGCGSYWGVGFRIRGPYYRLPWQVKWKRQWDMKWKLGFQLIQSTDIGSSHGHEHEP